MADAESTPQPDYTEPESTEPQSTEPQSTEPQSTPQPGYSRVPVGTVGRTTSPGKQILLTIVTLGIWAIVWVYRQHDDIKNYSGEGAGAVLGAVIYFFVAPVTWFLIPNEVENYLYHRDGKESPVRTIMGLWILLPIIGNFIWYLRIQAAINDFWVSKGAQAPA
jgi:hypothetical protein